MLGKAFPYPADAGFGALPVVLAGRSRGMEPAGPTRRRSACSCSIQGLCTPPPRLPLFAFSGATCAGSRSLWPTPTVPSRAACGAEVVNIPRGWTCKHCVQGVKVGARIAPNAFATADGGDCTETLGRWKRAGGFAFGQSPKRAAIIPDSRRALNMAKLLILSS